MFHRVNPFSRKKGHFKVSITEDWGIISGRQKLEERNNEELGRNVIKGKRTEKMPLRAAVNSIWRKTRDRMAGSCWKEGMRGWSSCVFVDE